MTRYELFRRRIAPALFFCLLGLIAYDACRKGQDAGITGTVVIELGEAEPRVRELEAQLFVGGGDEPINRFRLVAPAGERIGPCRFKARMPAPDGELRFTIDLGDARRELSRAVHIEDGATVRIDLAADLAR